MNKVSERFAQIYEADEWTNGSGPGSFSRLNEPFLSYVNSLLEEGSIKSIVDVGCGDFQLWENFDFGTCSYHGLDVVSGVVKRSERKHARPGIRFSVVPQCLDDLPVADLYIVKDVLIHLPNADALRLLEAVSARAAMVVVVNNKACAGGVYNEEIPVGGFRPVDIASHPFNCPLHQSITYGVPWAYDPRWPQLLARLLRRRVWPGVKHIQVVKGMPRVKIQD